MDARDEARLALDRLPSRFPTDGDAPKRSAWGSIAVGTLSIGLIAALAVFWQTGKPGPLVASAATPSALSVEEIDRTIEQGRTLIADGTPEQAVPLLEQLVDVVPTDRDSRVALGQAYLAAGRDDQAYQQFAQTLRDGPPDAQLQFAAGTLASKLGQPRVAIGHLRTAHDADPSNPDYALFLGQAELKEGRLDQARAALVRSTHARPEDARAWGMLAEIALRENRPEMALQHVGRARHHDPENDAWKIIQARSLKRRGEAAQATAVLGTLSDQAKLSKPVVRLAGECFGMLKRPDQAAALYRLASDAKPKDGELAFEAAVWLDKADQRPIALTYAKRAFEADHPSAEALVEKLSDQREFKAQPRPAG
ncbi:MAG: tetratricopeptide repeat protein [Planctomycetota bacterium]